MESTPKTAKVLSNCLLMHDWTQDDLAKAAGIVAPTVSHHLNGKRTIRDDHLAAYLPCLDRIEQRQLLSGWLQDVLPAPVQENVLDPASQRLQEDVTIYALGLTVQQQDQLKFWTGRIATDDDIAKIFAVLTRKAGGPSGE
jgi:transcriptional regulator with XRE-family HTH domain